MTENSDLVPKCPHCGGDMDLMPDFYHNSKVTWYGCDPCNTVFEFEPAPNGVVHVQTFWITYLEYLRLTKKRNVVQ